MYLVDTSVWIDYIQGSDARQISFLDELLKNPLAVGLTDLIYMEILQGAKDQSSFDQLRRYFSGQQFYRFIDPEQSHTSAAQIYFDCRRQGVTVRSTLDCLIAQCAIEHELILLHHDRDFKQMVTIVPALQQKHFLE
jgi:predicted nucleic acid-binding protein